MTDSDYRSIFPVHVLVDLIACALQDGDVVWNACRNVKLRSRESTKGMEINSIDGSCDEAKGRLFSVSVKPSKHFSFRSQG
jgi:hypothetical protein